MHLRWRGLKATAKDRGKNDGQHDGSDRLCHQANQAQCGVRRICTQLCPVGQVGRLETTEVCSLRNRSEQKQRDAQEG